MSQNLLNDFQMEPIITTNDEPITWFIDRTGDPTLLGSPYARYFRNNNERFADAVAINERVNNLRISQIIVNPGYFPGASDQVENNQNIINSNGASAVAAAYPTNNNNRINILSNSDAAASEENNRIILITRFHIDESFVNTFVTFPDVAVNEEMEVSEEERECCICMDQKEKTEICSLNCSHTYCSECVGKTLNLQFSQRQILSCSLCRTNVTLVQVKNIESKNKILMR